MKKTLTVAVVSALALAAGAAQARPQADLARVVAATPVHEQVSVPREQCWTQPVTTYETRQVSRPVYTPYHTVDQRPSGAGAVLGAVIGGVIGHQFGHSDRGRDHATVAGAVVGGLVGHQIERDRGSSYSPASHQAYTEQVPVTREVQQCRPITELQDRVVAYDVRYVYNGREYTTRLPYQPGRTLRVNVDVHPHQGYRPAPLRPVYVR